VETENITSEVETRPNKAKRERAIPIKASYTTKNPIKRRRLRYNYKNLY
jgi:hypothetical protein